MNYEEFIDYFIQEAERDLKDFLPEEKKSIELEVVPVLQNNGIIRTGLHIRLGSGKVKGFFLDHLFQIYENGMTISELLESFASELADDRTDLQQVTLENVFLAVVNLDDNQELLTSVPHRNFGDLAGIVKADLSNENDPDIYTATIPRWLMEEKGWTEESLFAAAFENTRKKLVISGLESVVISSFLGVEEEKLAFEDAEMLPEPKGVPFYVVSNQKRCWGDALLVLPDRLQVLADHFGSSLILLPSSVHETIVVPENRLPKGIGLSEMLKSVNATDLQPQERLSNSIYRYDRMRHVVELLDDEGNAWKKEANAS